MFSEREARIRYLRFISSYLADLAVIVGHPVTRDDLQSVAETRLIVVRGARLTSAPSRSLATTGAVYASNRDAFFADLESRSRVPVALFLRDSHDCGVLIQSSVREYGRLLTPELIHRYMDFSLVTVDGEDSVDLGTMQDEVDDGIELTWRGRHWSTVGFNVQ